jgi:hypothetical protein
MTNRNKDLRAIIERVIGEAGFEYEIRGGGKHPKAVIYANGRTFTHSFPSTPSDYRSQLNCEAELRRRLRDFGVSLAADAEPAVVDLVAEPVAAVPPAAVDHGAVQVIHFNGAAIETMEVNGEPHVALKPIVEGMGLAWNAQLERVKRDPVLSEGMRVTRIPSSGGAQQAAMIPLKMLNGFLFGIDSGRVKPAVRDGVIAYQRECYDALSAYWMTGAAVKGEVGALAAPDDDSFEMMRMIVEDATAPVRDDIGALGDMLAKHGDIALSDANKRAIGGVVKNIVGPIVRELAALRERGAALGSYDMTGRVTASQILTMAGVPEKGRVRGAAQRVTGSMNRSGYAKDGDRMPAQFNPAQPWTWPIGDARKWLENGGRHMVLADHHRAQVAKGAKDGGQGVLHFDPRGNA